ncbi:MAG: glycosyltransferase family 4 protein [Chitinophagales bacterium]|nr:glycosyltransferase family 4 protein [Chitinophagales bacterium]
MSNLRILFAINSLARGGAERLALDICNELNSKKGVEQMLIVFNKQNDYPEITKDLPVCYCNSKVYMKFPNRTISNLKSFRKICDSFQPHIIHSHLFYADQITRENINQETAYFSHVHGPVSPYEPMKLKEIIQKKKIIEFFTRKRILKRYRECNNQFIANSAYTMKYLLKFLPFKASSLHLLENAINLQRFSFVSKNLPQRELNLVTTGNLIPRKNHLFLLEIIKILKEDNYAVHLDILGEGNLHTAIWNKIVEYGLENNIALRGSVGSVEDYLHGAHLYVHGATHEPFGLAIVEAMATGLPVVCLDGQGNRGIIDDGVNGFMIANQNATLFAEKIRRIIDNEITYKRFSVNAGRKARQYDITGYADKLLSLYQSFFPSDNISSTNKG